MKTFRGRRIEVSADRPFEIYADGDPIGGRSLAEFSLEARIRLSQLGGNFGFQWRAAGLVFGFAHGNFDVFLAFAGAA